jgi:hypothetical protein
MTLPKRENHYLKEKSPYAKGKSPYLKEKRGAFLS